MPTDEDPLQDLLTHPNPARVYDSWLGGKDNFAVDREIASQVAELAPHVVNGVRANRAFLQRAVAYLAEAGVEQFIDLGSGLPTRNNVHEIAGRINGDAKVTYVDHDPIVLAHARALLADRSRTIVVEGDIRDPDQILSNKELLAHIDFDRPVAVICAAILHFVTDEQDPWGVVRAFRDRLVKGSYLAVSHVASGDDHQQDAATHRAADLYAAKAAPFVVRSREEIGRLFEGFRLVEPGLVVADEWRRSGNGRTRAPVLAGVGVLDRESEDRIPVLCGCSPAVGHGE